MGLTSLVVTPPQATYCGWCGGAGEVEVWDDEEDRPGWVDCGDCGGSGFAVWAPAGRVWVWVRRAARVVNWLSWCVGWGPSSPRR